MSVEVQIKIIDIFIELRVFKSMEYKAVVPVDSYMINYSQNCSEEIKFTNRENNFFDLGSFSWKCRCSCESILQVSHPRSRSRGSQTQCFQVLSRNRHFKFLLQLCFLQQIAEHTFSLAGKSGSSSIYLVILMIHFRKGNQFLMDHIEL